MDTLQGAEGYLSEGVTDSLGLASCGRRRFLVLTSKGFGGPFAWCLGLEIAAVVRRREEDSSLCKPRLGAQGRRPPQPCPSGLAHFLYLCAIVITIIQ